jgi:hypothetical protein
LWLAIKFLAFYIALHVFVNMIFIHLYDFIRFPVLAVFLAWRPCLGIYRFAGFKTAYRIMQAAKQDISHAAFLRRSVFLAFVNRHGYNLTL